MSGVQFGYDRERRGWYQSPTGVYHWHGFHLPDRPWGTSRCGLRKNSQVEGSPVVAPWLFPGAKVCGTCVRELRRWRTVDTPPAQLAGHAVEVRR